MRTLLVVAALVSGCGPAGPVAETRPVRIGVGALQRDTNSIRLQTYSPDSPTQFEVGDVVTLWPGEKDFPPGEKTITQSLALSFEVDYDEPGPDALSTREQYFTLTRRASAAY